MEERKGRERGKKGQKKRKSKDTKQECKTRGQRGKEEIIGEKEEVAVSKREGERYRTIDIKRDWGCKGGENCHNYPQTGLSETTG